MPPIKKVNLFLLFCLPFSMLMAQLNNQDAYTAFNQTPAVVEEELFRIDFITPGFQYEKAMSENSTLQVEVYASPYLDLRGFDLVDADFILLPKIELAYRFYYNLSKRKSKLKNFTNNSGLYISPKLSASFVSGFDIHNIANIGCVWGFQNNGFPVTWNFEAGLGYGINYVDYRNPSGTELSNGHLAILSKLTIGFLVGYKNRMY